jgi:hypothetical protein
MKTKLEIESPQPKVITLEYLTTREFTTPSEFSMFIEKQSIKRKIGCLEALLEYCDEKGIDPTAVSSFITSSLKEKIRAEAEEMNLLKKTAKLPV